MYWMGIDLGGTNIVAGLVDETRTIVDRIPGAPAHGRNGG